MKTVLITGGAGFIGSAFTHYIYRKYPDYRVVVVDSLTYAGNIENLPVKSEEQDNPRFAFWYGNVTNAELMDTLIEQANIVVHFAAETHVTRSIYDNMLFFQTDVLGTQAVASAICKYRDRIERFVHISSSEVYGTASAPVMDETHSLNPMSPYAAAKAGADRLVYSYWATYGVPAVIVRPFNNYGPRQHLEKLIPRFITATMLGEKLRVHGDGSAARDFVHVDDTCAALDLLMHAPPEKVVGEIFNIGTGSHRSIAEIARDIARIMEFDLEPNMEFIGNRPGQVFRHTADGSKIRRIVGWSPRIGWDDGLKQTIEWYQKNRDWWSKQLWMRNVPIVTSAGKMELH